MLNFSLRRKPNSDDHQQISQPNNLQEYLYLDENRINAYYEQLGGALKYDKVPVYNSTFGLNAIGFGATQTRVQRPATVYEKLEHIYEGLSSERMILDGRYHGGMNPDQGVPFRIESLVARQAWLPPRSGQVAYPEGLTMWLGYAELQQDSTKAAEGSLYLLQSYAGEDRPIYKYTSPVSFLCELARAVTDENTIALMDSLPTKLQNAGFERRMEMDRDPIGTLKKLGANVGEPRLIRTLYKIRTFYRERPMAAKGSLEYDPQPATFGYPLFVVEAD